MQNQTTALAQSTGGAIQQAPELAMPVPAEAIKARHTALGEIMKSVMQKGTDYDEIPGTNKPTLLKSGAETLMSCFMLHPELEVIERYDPNIEQELEVWETQWSGPKGNRTKERVKKTLHKRGFYEVIAKCTLRVPSGNSLGTLSGSCNSWEAKYVTQSLHDVKNTVLKMAEKRAIVAAVLAATGASRIFTQDVEDMPHLHQDAASGKSEKKESAPKEERKDPPPEAVFAFNEKQIALAKEKGLDALRALKLDGGKWMSEAQIAQLRQLKKQAIAELEAGGPAAGEYSQEAQSATTSSDTPSPDPKVVKAHADALYQRLSRIDKDLADRLCQESTDDLDCVSKLHSALVDMDPDYKPQLPKRLNQENPSEAT